jgi:hypothetical protein
LALVKTETMKAITILFVGVGLASAQISPAPIAVNGGQVDPNLFNSSAGLGSVASGSNDESSAFSGLNLDQNLNLEGLDVNGLNLGSVDFNNQNDLLNAILLMMNSLCLGDLVQAAQIQQLGQVAQLEMFLELAQLMSLAQTGLINLSEIQSLSSSGLLFSGFSVGSVFKREFGSHKRVSNPVDDARRMKVGWQAHTLCRRP